MKKLFNLLFLAFTVFSANATVVYTDIADATLSLGASIDINFTGAGSAEITFSGGGFDAVVPGVMFAATGAHLTTVSTAEWDIIKGYPVSTNIDANTGWYDMGDAYIDPDWGTTKFPSTADSYIGASFKIGANVHYGWIRVNWNGNGTFIVKDYAYENSSNTLIKAGNTGIVGISDVNSDVNISVFPNPTKDYLNIKTNKEIQSVNIHTVDGSMVYSKNLVGIDNMISVIDLPAGFYTMQIVFKNGELNVTRVLKY